MNKGNVVYSHHWQEEITLSLSPDFVSLSANQIVYL
jgi:hypothetical protein